MRYQIHSNDADIHALYLKALKFVHAKEWSESKAIMCAIKELISCIAYPDMSEHLHTAVALALQFIDYWEVCDVLYIPCLPIHT